MLDRESSLGNSHDSSWLRWNGWKRLSSPASTMKAAASGHGFAVALALITLFHFWLSAKLAPSEDELYYWTWAKNLQWSYFDHPPMVAYLIALSTKIFGDNLFGIRFFAVLGSFGIFAALGRLGGTRPPALLYLLFTPIFFLGGVLMTPDLPLVFFWTLYLLWTVKLSRLFSGWSGDPLHRVYYSSPIPWTRWLSGGLLLGLGCLSKYTMFLAVPCVFLCLATRYRWRAWLGGFAFHLSIAALVCLPILFYNQAHGFQPLLFQWKHAMSGGGSGHFWSFLGAQILLLGALPFLMLPWVLMDARELNSNPRMSACFFFFVPPFLFFLVKAMGANVEGNWPLVAYVGFWPIALRLLHHSSFKTAGSALLFVSFALPCLVSLAVLVHVITPLKFLSAENDRVGKLASQYELAKAAASDAARLMPGETVFAPTYQWTSYLRFEKVPADQIYPEGRASQFTVEPVSICERREALVLEESSHRARALSCFTGRKVLGEYPLVVRGVRLASYQLARYTRNARNDSDALSQLSARLYTPRKRSHRAHRRSR